MWPKHGIQPERLGASILRDESDFLGHHKKLIPLLTMKPHSGALS